MVLLTGILGMRGEECVLTELNKLLTSTRGGWLTWYRRSISLGWVVDFGYRRSFGPWKCVGGKLMVLVTDMGGVCAH